MVHAAATCTEALPLAALPQLVLDSNGGLALFINRYFISLDFGDIVTVSDQATIR